jgi:hypothetical protein
MKTAVRLACLLAAAALLGLSTSCGDAEYEYSSKPCFLVIDNSVRQNVTLSQAMTQHAGVYVTIRQTSRAGARYFSFTSNQGTSSEAIFNAVDERNHYILGQNNGLIVGYGSSIDGILYAFDAECSNCFSPESIPLKSHPLTVDGNGTATCATCRRHYDLNQGGIITVGDPGKKLIRYPATTTGPFGVLRVN